MTNPRTAQIMAALKGHAKRTEGQLPSPPRRKAKKTNASGTSTEHVEQCAIVEYLRRRGVTAMALVNGSVLAGDRQARIRQSSYLKAEGMTPGAPDLILSRLSQGGAPVAVEMKAVGGKVSEAQRLVHRRLEDAGWIVLVAFGSDDAIAQLGVVYGW